MTTEMYLHSAKDLTEDDIACWFGHDWTSKHVKRPRERCTEGRPNGPLPMELWLCIHSKAVGESPRVFISETSYDFTPTAQAFMKLVPRDTFPVLDAALAGGLTAAADEWLREDLVPWLDDHAGEPLFYIHW